MMVDAPNSFAVFLNFHSSGIVSPLVIMVQMQVLSIDHGDGKFLGTMECQWFSSRYHCGQWFFNGFFTSEPSLSMVFHISTIGINGFSNGFSISDDGFSMVFYR